MLYKIMNHEVNDPSEGIQILAKGGTRKSQVHNKCMHIGSNIDDYKYSFHTHTIPEWNKFHTILLTLQVLRPSMIGGSISLTRA